MAVKHREKGYDLIRALSMLTIVIYHYTFNYTEYSISGAHPQLAKLINCDWGSAFVIMFIMLSGATMYLNHMDYENPVKFYYKRWLSIFPIFYIAYIPAFIAQCIETNMLYWGGDRKNIIYTILGIDGYFLKPGVNLNYYRLGEWFLGAIIMVYILYPVLRAAFSKKIGRILLTLGLLFAFIFVCYTDYFDIVAGKNMLTILFQFVIGMHICVNIDRLKGIKPTVASMIIAILMTAIKLPIKEPIAATLLAIALFIIIFNAAKYIMKNTVADKIVVFLAKNSFGIFLVHHLIIYAFMKRFEGSSIDLTMWIGLLIVNLVLIITAGTMLTICAGVVVKGIDYVVKSISIILHKSFAGKDR